MKINRKTKISKLIKEKEEAIEVIASLNKHFAKLRNPVLRKVLASRVTIQEAAKIGKCEVEEMLLKLSAIGFEIEEEIKDTETINPEDKSAQKKVFLNGKSIVTVDVRPYLENNEDPLLLLQKKLKGLKEGEALEILIDFEPIPLIRIQEKKGWETFSVVEKGVYHTYFQPGKKADKSVDEVTEEALYIKVNSEEYEKLIAGFQGELITLDVRMLEMPQPMMTILETIENLPKNGAIKIFHKRIPQHLLPELQPKKLKTYIDYREEGEVMMFITR